MRRVRSGKQKITGAVLRTCCSSEGGAAAQLQWVAAVGECRPNAAGPEKPKPKFYVKIVGN